MARRRASLYIMTLATAMLVTLAGVTATLAVRVQQRGTQDLRGGIAARVAAQSALDLGLYVIETTPDWRNAYASDTWFDHLPLDQARYSLVVTDPDDGDLTDAPCDEVLLTGYGFCGNARQMLQVRIAHAAADTDMLRDAVLAKTPLAYWRLGEAGGTAAADAVGAQPGEYKNGVTQGVGVPYRCDPAIACDGVNDFVEVPHNAAFLLANGTLQFWFAAEDVNTLQGLVCKDSYGYDAGGHLWVGVSGGQVWARLQSLVASYWVNSAALNVDTWYQVVFTWGTAGIDLYINGALVDSDTYMGGTTGNTQPLAFGVDLSSAADGSTSGWNNPFRGKLDEVALWGRTLSAAEISELYQAGAVELAQPMNAVVGSWREVVD